LGENEQIERTNESESHIGYRKIIERNRSVRNEKVLLLVINMFVVGSYIIHKGVIIRARHHTTGGSTPTSRGNQAGKEIVWDIIKSDQDEQREPSTVIIRSHVHYSFMCESMGRTFIITPCMKGMFDEYGQTKCSGTIDIGFGVLDIMDDGSVMWRKRILKPCYQKENVKEL